MNTKVKWYRNASEKDQDNVKGKGELMAIMPMQNNAGGSAVIADDEGNIVEKELSLIKIDKEPSINVEALENELNKAVEANGKFIEDINGLQELLDKAVDEKVKAVAEIKKLKDQIIQLNKKVTPTTVHKSDKPVKK